MTVDELLKVVKDDDKIWDLYANGITATLNQCDGEWATGLVKRYKPRNLAELSMFISCLRPFFNSSREAFINREKYSTGSVYLDEVLKSSNAYILFQESLMQYFEWLGVTPAESIGIIKKISKKKIKPDDFNKLKERIKKQWVINTGSEDQFEETFQTIHDCMSYGFAAPHALGVAIDSLYSAYLKVTYPLEYLTVCLNNYLSDDDKTKRLQKEARYFGIKISAIKFRRSDAYYICDKQSNTIYKGIASVKYLNETVSHELYKMRNMKFESFTDFLKVNPCDRRQTEILIKLNYFEEFGGGKMLMKEFELFNRLNGKKSLKKDNLAVIFDILSGADIKSVLSRHCKETPKMYQITESDELLKDLVSLISNEEYSTIDIAKFQYKELGYIDVTDDKLPKKIILVTNLNTTYSPRFIGYCLNNGSVCNLKVRKSKKGERTKELKNTYSDTPFEDGDILIVSSFKHLPKTIKTDNGFEKDYTQKEWWVYQYKKVVV